MFVFSEETVFFLKCYYHISLGFSWGYVNNAIFDNTTFIGLKVIGFEFVKCKYNIKIHAMIICSLWDVEQVN